MAIGVRATLGPQATYTEDFLPDDTLRETHSAVEGAHISHILVYELLLSDAIPRDEEGSVAGDHIRDNASSPMGRELYALHTVVIHCRDGAKVYLATDLAHAMRASIFLEARPDPGWEHSATVRRIPGTWGNDPNLRLRHRIPFQLGELLTQVEVFTSPEYVQTVRSATQSFFNPLCAAIRFLTSTGRSVQVGDANDIGGMPDALHFTFACSGLVLEDSYIHSFQIRHGELASVTTRQCPRFLLRHGLLTNTQIRRLWVGVGHHIHGIVMEYEDGSQ